MLILNIVALAVLLAVSGLHLLWAMKIWWPVSDEKRLVHTVAGFPNTDSMPPPIACLIVAVALLGVAILLFLRLTQPVPHHVVSVALLGAGFVFVGRGGIGFTGLWSRITPEQPFRKLDRNYYSPLCLVVGAVILVDTLL
ncbi:DUF3995 domain-containing protein [uncultured Ruegeria sp.]|uniref:DUF3995 domain-containing protein n=1 Tax=uncultured Ruegeria sp. TaxID=259304 RepID=UPI0026059E3C|nr:DUF3995 domain-containing protein [uncultured Ruegeria sp.]